MNGWLLDTNVVSAISTANPDPPVARWMRGQPQYSFYLSILTLAEYHKGIRNLPQPRKLRQTIEHTVLALEARFAGRILSVSDEIVLRWGAISGEVKRLTGHPPAVIDTMLAATAIEHNLYLATRNTADVKNSGAAIFNPWKDDPAQFPVL